MSATDAAFAGSIPAIYDRHLGPWLFEQYAEEAARRVKALSPKRVLETAAGTGILTEKLAELLPDAEIVATDLNPGMLDVAQRRCGSGKVTSQAADAQDLPFDAETFDVVVCQFGLMFYPDKVRGNSEAFRVLREGGTYLAIVWDSIDRNPVPQAIDAAVAAEFPDDPPRFISRTPWGYADRDRIEADLRAAGFSGIEIEAVESTRPLDAAGAATGLCQGSPLKAEIEARDPNGVQRATDAATSALKQFDGKDTTLSALFVTATR